jgi:AcrR family transcriptional regulator
MDRTEQKILQIGRTILVEEGLRSVTTNTIAQRARISKKTLYRHFPSKDELVERIGVTFLEAQLSRWDEILEGSASAIDRILESLKFISHFLPQIQTSLINQVEQISPQLWERVDAIRMQRLIRLKLLVSEAQTEGYFRSDVDPEHWILLLTSTVRNVIVPRVLLERGILLPDLVNTIKTIFYDGLLTEKGRVYIDTHQEEKK